MEHWEEYLLSSVRNRASTAKRNAETILAGNGSASAEPTLMTKGELETQLRAEPGDWDEAAGSPK